MTDAEAEALGREWAAKRGRVPAVVSHKRRGSEWHWESYRMFADIHTAAELPDVVYSMLPQGPRAYPTDAAAYAALGRAIAAGREVFA